MQDPTKPFSLEVPQLNNEFFAVCSTAIKNCSWKYSEMETIRMVEGQLAALHSFYAEFYVAKKKAAEAVLAAQNANGQKVDDQVEQPAEAGQPIEASPEFPDLGEPSEPVAAPALEPAENAPDTQAQPETPVESEEEKKKS